MKIVFLDCTTTNYNGDTLGQKALGGIETVTICLAEALAAIDGNTVIVVNNSEYSGTRIIRNVRWMNRDHFFAHGKGLVADVVVANNDPRLFDQAAQIIDKPFTPVLWMHNRILLEKTIRKMRLLSFYRWNPVGVFLSENQQNACNRFHRFRRKVLMHHGLSSDFLNGDIVLPQDSLQAAMFFSQPYRGLREVVSCWVRYIHPICPEAVFKVCVGDINMAEYNIPYSKNQLAEHNIVIMPRLPKVDLINHLKYARLVIYPGHKDETYCSVAAEANALGVPLVSFGRGALSERVRHGYNGFLVADGDLKTMGNRAIELLKNENDCLAVLSNNARAYVSNLSWDGVADKWMKKVF